MAKAKRKTLTKEATAETEKTLTKAKRERTGEKPKERPLRLTVMKKPKTVTTVTEDPKQKVRVTKVRKMARVK
jgi:hypothetical protein